jgi:hypothetical protein
MKTRIKLGVILIVSIIALAGISGSYALSSKKYKFYDYCKCEGSCCPSKCGSVGVRDVGTGDPGPNYLQPNGKLYPIKSPCDGTADPQYGLGHNEEGKNVASTISCNGKYSCSMYKNCKQIKFYKDVTECINNAYPWYSSSFKLWFGNCGEIPVTVSKIELKVTSGSNELLKFLKIHNWIIKIDETFYAQGSTFEELISKLKCTKLKPNQILSLIVDFHFEEEYIDCSGVVHLMPQMTSMTFKVDVTWVQSTCK